MAEKSVIDLLMELPEAEIATKTIKVKRLSKEGAPVLLGLTGIPYARVLEIKKQPADLGVAILLEGVTEPELRNRALMEKHKAATPEELIKKLLLPGEIEDIAREVEMLSGYRINTIEDFKKN